MLHANVLRRYMLVAGFAVLGGTTSIGSATAQQLAQSTPDQQVEQTQDRQAAIESSVHATRAAIEAMSADDCPPVSYADVLAKPDDTALNVCFARGQINNGNVTGAVATLERILLIAPDAANVRYLYAIALYRLDNINEAEREFLTLMQGDLPDDVRLQINAFLSEIAQLRKTTKQTLTVSMGLYYDTNRNTAPQSESLVAAGVRGPIQLKEDRPNDDIGLLTIAGYDLAHDLGLRDPHELIGGIDLYADTLREQGHLSTQAMNIDTGLRLRYPGFVITPRLFLSNMRLGRAKFYHSTGGEIRVDHKLRLADPNMPLLDTWGSFSAQNETYRNTPEFQTLTLRTGKKFDTRIGIGALVHPQHYVSLVGHHQYKGAAPDSGNSNLRTFRYKYWGAKLSHTWLLGAGRFLQSDLSVGARQYKVPDAVVSPDIHRIEQPVQARVTYGMPLVDVIGMDWLDSAVNSNGAILDLAKETTLTMTGEWRYQRSNITNYQYDAKRVQVLLTRRFDF